MLCHTDKTPTPSLDTEGRALKHTALRTFPRSRIRAVCVTCLLRMQNCKSARPLGTKLSYPFILLHLFSMLLIVYK